MRILPAPGSVAAPGRKVGRRRRAGGRRGGPVRADTARAEGRGVEGGDVDGGPVVSSSPHGLRRNVDATVRVAERRHDLRPDFVPVARDRRAERGMEVFGPDATGGEGVERGVEDARGGASPAGVDGGDPAGLRVGQNDRHAVGGGDEEKDVWLAGENGVAGSEDAAPALTRRFFEGEGDGGRGPGSCGPLPRPARRALRRGPGLRRRDRVNTPSAPLA